MKKIFPLIFIAFITLIWSSCTKTKNDPEALDYYKNKDIVLTLSSENIQASDLYDVKISAVALGDRPNGNPKLIVNGTMIDADYAVINKDMILDGPVTITATDKAWQFVAEYTARSSSGFTVKWNSTFNGVPQKEYLHNVNSVTNIKGYIEVKEYE